VNHQTLYIIVGALVMIGVLATIAFARRTSRKAARGIREATVVGGTIVRALVGGIVIAGIELAVALSVHDWRVLAAVFAVPAILAGVTVARMFAVGEFVRVGRGYRR
jgi:hypothetical protein